MKKPIHLIAVLWILLQQTDGAKILGVFTIPAISHQRVFQPIWRELSLRGHEVTVIAPNPLNDPTLVNLTEIDVSFAYPVFNKHRIQDSMGRSVSVMSALINAWKAITEVTKLELAHQDVQALLKNQSNKFDLILVEAFSPLMYALSVRFQCPFIGIKSTVAFTTTYDSVGNPSHPVLNPDIMLTFLNKLTFFERLYSTFYLVWSRWYYHYVYIPEHDRIAKKYISENLPYLGDIEKNISMLFVNSNPITDPIRPNVPAVVELSFLNIKERKPLPKDLQNELDAATEGVVYFSLGTNIKINGISLELKNELIGAILELPYKVFLKWDDDHPPILPKNVVVRKWFPQQDILAHPNVKVFFSQGGLQSLEESIYNKVPLVVMPVLGDQPANAKKVVNLGIGRVINCEQVTTENLKAALMDVAENIEYHNRIREVAGLMTDVPMTGLEKAIWWIEYVIRHKGARHLRSPALDLPSYQYFLLDVLGFILVGVIVICYIFYKMLALCLRFAKKMLVNSKLKTS